MSEANIPMICLRCSGEMTEYPYEWVCLNDCEFTTFKPSSSFYSPGPRISYVIQIRGLAIWVNERTNNSNIWVVANCKDFRSWPTSLLFHEPDWRLPIAVKPTITEDELEKMLLLA